MSVVITIPIYRKTLGITEKVSLQQLRKVLGHYPCVLVAPESLDFAYEGLEDGIKVERFPDQWFTSITSYSQLLLSDAYYARFATYDYMLIYQLDAFVFVDKLQDFCELGYDYIGAPIAFYQPIWHAIGARVGNGGLSLRKISSARRVLKKWKELPLERKQIFQDIFFRVEDAFWGWCGVQEDMSFQCAPLETALCFSVQGDIQHCYKRIADGTLKIFGCHGWNETNTEFWREQIKACGYDLTAWKKQSGISKRTNDLRNYWQKRRYIDLIRLWGALHKRKYTAMTITLLEWLERYPSGDKIWAGLGEELQYIWRRCRQERIEHPKAIIELERLEQVMDEAISRVLKAGNVERRLSLLLESLLPLISQSKSLAAEELCRIIKETCWQQWEGKAIYAKPVPKGIKKHHVVAISMVKNEMDIIESFVRHTLSFADELLILDHQSSDKTRNILESLLQEGLPLTIHKTYRVEYAQAEMTTELMYEAINEHGADIVIPLDADEFLVGTIAGKSIREYLEELDSSCIYALPWRRYIPYQPEEQINKFLLARPVLRDDYYDEGHKCIIGAKLVLAHRLKLIQGNHYVYSEHDGQKISMSMLVCSTMELAHFYWRSHEQFHTKIAVGWPNIVARYSLAAVGGGGYRNFHSRMLRGQQISPLEFLKQASIVDLRPFVEQQVLLYSQQVTPNPMANLMQASVLLAERVVEQHILTQKVLVTTVVPYLGDNEDFSWRLQQASDQDYPWQQIIIPCIIPPSEKNWALLQKECKGKLQDKFEWLLLVESTGADVFAQLSVKAKGRLVHWHLPGTDVVDIFLTRMVAGMTNQNFEYSVLISDGREDYRNELPYVTIHPIENTQVALGADFWHRLLEIGKYPAGNITAALISRQVMEKCSWLRNAFLRPEGALLSFTAWKILAEASATEFIGVITECYTEVKHSVPTLDILVLHQLEWLELLQLEQGKWQVKNLRAVAKIFCRNGNSILTQAVREGIDTTVPLWRHYQQVLLQISDTL